MKKLPLEGILVVDFTWVGAGPNATKILADSGAEVIKIESGIRPDVLRLTAPFAEGKKGLNRSGYFSNRNTSKRSMKLDMSKEESKELIKRLIKKADIVANSFTPKTMDNWGLGYKDLKKINEKIIYLCMPMQGTTGPHKDYMGFGATMNALIGFNTLSGFPNREPIGTGTNYPDHVPNPAHAAFGVLASLRYRNKTGKGQYVEVAQTESALSVLGTAIMEAANNNRIPEPTGNRVSYAAPNGAYRCQGEDSWCVISCTNESEWLNFLKASGLKNLEDDIRFKSFSSRIENADALDDFINQWTRAFSPEEVMQLLQAKGVPAGVVQSSEDLVERDPQLKYRDHFVKLNHPEMGESIYNNIPFKLSKTPSYLRRPAPLLGEATDYVCKELIGLSDEEYQYYKEKNIFQ